MAAAIDRRRAVLRLGISVILVGLLLAALVPLAQWVIGRSISDGALRAAVQAAIGRATADLLSIGSWVAAYGVVGAAASATGSRAS